MLTAIAAFANGDARSALSTLEMVVLNGEVDENGVTVTKETLEQCTSKKSLLYDKQGEEHYNLISALHKSMRNSDPDAAVYWLARMLEAGEDPLYIARRVTRFASEDVGLADPRALEIAVAAYQACHFIGMPECTVHLTEAVVYLALAPKSNALYEAYGRARGGRAFAAGRAGAAGHPQRADEAHARTGLRQGLPVRPRRGGKADEHAVPARLAAGARILPTHGTGRGGQVQGKASADQGVESGTRAKVRRNRAGA